MKLSITERKRYPTPTSDRTENQISPVTSRAVTANISVRNPSAISNDFPIKRHQSSVQFNDILNIQKLGSELNMSNNSEFQPISKRKISIQAINSNSPSTNKVVYRTLSNFSQIKLSKSDVIEGFVSTKRTNSEAVPNTNLTTRVNLSKTSGFQNFQNNGTGDIEYKKISDKIELVKEKLTSSQNLVLINSEVTKQMKNVLTHFKITLDNAVTRFLLFPDSEKTIIDSLCEAELYLINLVKLIKKNIDKIFEENQQLQSQTKAAQEDLNALRDSKNEALKAFVNMTYVHEKNEMMEKMEIASKDQQKNELIWHVERQKLLAEIDALNKQIIEYQNQDHYEVLKREYDILKEKMGIKVKGVESAIEKRNNRIYKLEMQLGGEKAALEQLQQQHSELQQKHDRLNINYEDLKEEIEKVIDREIRFRESYYILKEDCRQKDIKTAQADEVLFQTRRRCQELQKKVDSLHRAYEVRVGMVDKDFDKDSTLLKSVKEIFNNNKHPIINLNIEKYRSDIADIPLDNITIPRYTYYKPTFFNFIEKELDDKMNNPFDEIMMNEKEFIGIIRGIFDSKYNEALYYDNYKLVSSFPDFVYSWLSTYVLDLTEKRVKAVGPDDHVDVNRRRLNFYQKLLNHNMGKVWDVMTFRDFLEEKYTSDEIFFYLHCRYLLFQGAQLDYLTSAVNTVHWVQLDRADRLIEHVLKRMNSEQLKTTKNQIKQRAKLKYGKLLVDSGFLLKILLDYYRHEKKMKFVSIQQSFMKIGVAGKDQKPHVQFDSFKVFLEERYPFISDLDKAKLYREAWCVGNGNVDYESFFIAANESNFFIDALKHQPFKDLTPIPISITTSNSKPSEEVEALSTLLTSKYEQLSDFFVKCKRFARNLGIEPVILEVDQIEAYLMRNHSQELSKGENFYQAFNRLTQIFVKARNQYFSIHKHSLADQKQIIQADLKGFEIVLDSVDFYYRIDDAEFLDKSRKVKKLQGFCKNKMSKWNNVLNLLRERLREEKEKNTKNSPKLTPRESKRNSIVVRPNSNTASNQNTPNKSKFVKGPNDKLPKK